MNPPGAVIAFMREWVAQVTTPKIALLNKVDQMRDKTKLLPRIEAYAGQGFDEIVPISALEGDGVDRVLELMWQRLPHGPLRYDPELLTVHPERFLVAERIREKVLEQTREELPFTTTVVIDAWQDREDGLLTLYATILAERPGQKKILIGAGGQQIKSIGTAARHDLEAYLGRRVFLDLQVKVEQDWRENRRVLSELDRAPYAVEMP